MVGYVVGFDVAVDLGLMIAVIAERIEDLGELYVRQNCNIYLG